MAADLDLDALEALVAEHPLRCDEDRQFIGGQWQPAVCKADSDVWLSEQEVHAVVTGFNVLPALLARLRAAERDAALGRKLGALRVRQQADCGDGYGTCEDCGKAIAYVVRAHWAATEGTP